MRNIKSLWLEIVFILFILAVCFFSINNSVHDITIVNEQTMPQSGIQPDLCDFSSYIKGIKQLENCTMVIVVKDIQGYCTTQEMMDELKSIGFDQADVLLENSYHSFIGVYSNGEVVYQNIGGDEKIEFGQIVGNQYIYANSATYSAGNTGEIYIDDVQYSVNSRGFNIVTFDNVNRQLIDSVAFDVYVEEIPVYRINNNGTS